MVEGVSNTHEGEIGKQSLQRFSDLPNHLLPIITHGRFGIFIDEDVLHRLSGKSTVVGADRGIRFDHPVQTYGVQDRALARQRAHCELMVIPVCGAHVNTAASEPLSVVGRDSNACTEIGSHVFGPIVVLSIAVPSKASVHAIT
ncbi:hypothetical protein D3C80_1297740 [compost metagenome]